MTTTPGHPHPYGDCDACGDPTPLIQALKREGERLGIDLSGIEAFNSWDMSLSLGGRQAAQLLIALRQATEAPTEQRANAVMLELVEGIDSVGG